MTELQKSPSKSEAGDSLVVQMLNLAVETAQTIGESSVVALDAYFSSEKAWSVVDKTLTATGERLVEIVTRAQSNTVALLNLIENSDKSKICRIFNKFSYSTASIKSEKTRTTPKIR